MKKIFVLFLILSLSACTTMTPLTKATKECDLSATRTLIAHGSSVNETSSGKWTATPLHMAAYHCSDEEALKIIRVLVDQGAALETKDNDGQTPLLIATQGKPKSALYLIEHGANIGARDGSGNSPMIHAAAAGSLDMTKALILRKADVNAYNTEGVTPLINAAIYGDIALVKVLLDAGGDPLHRDVDGKSARDYALSYKNNDAADLLRETEKRPEFVKPRTQRVVRIKSIVERVTECMMPETKEYAIAISNDTQPNASVNLSGQIIFTEGALSLWDDDTLTFIAAHEIAHDKLGHVGKKIAVSAATTGVMIIANFFIPGVGLLNHALNPALVNNYSKTQELEADKLASESCEKCFGMTNVKQIEIMMQMRKTSREGGGFWATHPAWSERIKNIKQ
jgi:ankyrin repeat protein